MAYIGQKPANKAVVADDLDPTVITGQTALTDKPADTDEFLISDAGTLKRIDASLVGGGGVDWQSTIVTGATHTVSAGQGIWIDTSSNACTLTLPASPSVGDQVIFTDYARKWGTNAVTLNLNSEKFQGNTTPVPVYDTTGESVDIVYSGSTKGWIPNTDGSVVNETAQPYSADFLVIAGGAGGGFNIGGGGGAGGYRTSTQTVNANVVLSVTIGDGGAGSVADTTEGTNGSDSSISGSGITTITSNGGGGGGAGGGSGRADGLDGGSGGGGNGDFNGSGGSGNTPSTSPSQGNDGGNGNTSSPNYGGGGGGGAGAVGSNGSSSAGGNGGAGAASSITGSSVTRAGGGGGGTYNGGTAGTGGTGGGGTGSVGASGTAATNGTANTGGGGGGEGRSATGNAGSGGKGVIFISVPTANYSGTTTGFPTVTTSGSNTIIQFNGDGTYTT